VSRFRLLVVLSLALSAGLSSSASASSSACASADVSPAGAPAKARSATLCLINRERRAEGLPRLRPNRLLAVAAGRHGRDMVDKAYFAHDSLDGRTFDARIKATGYLSGANGWTVGENIAWGQGERSTPRSIVAGWMASPPHRRNILSPGYSRIGITIIQGAPVDGVGDNAATYTTSFGHRG
jgi:uncharacterized protein YkwD